MADGSRARPRDPSGSRVRRNQSARFTAAIGEGRRNSE